MAVTKAENSASRRLFIRVNVLVAVVLAVFALVGVNLIGQLKNARFDLTGGMSGHRVSERTKNILKQSGKDRVVRITTVYASDDPETSRKEFFPRVQDLSEELQAWCKSQGIPFESSHIISGDDQAKLRDRVQEKFGSAAREYNEVVTLAQDVWKDVKESLTAARQQVIALAAGDSWVGGFPALANIASILQKDIKNTDDTNQEVENLVRGQGIPRYSEANEKIKSLNDDLKQHIEQIQGWSRETDKLAKVLADPNADFVKTTRTRLKEMADKVAELKNIAGDPRTTDVPADPKPLLQNFAKASIQFGEFLTAESTRVNAFLNEHPALRQHPRWQIKTGMFVVDLSNVLNSAAESVGTNGRALRGYLQQNVPLDQLQNLVRQTRQIGVETGEMLQQWNTTLTAVLDEGAGIDEPSKAFLAHAGGDLFTKALERVDAVATKIGTLPELKLDEIATRMQQDNIIVVERGDDVRVVTFDEAWLYADPSGRMSARDEDGPPLRVFDGDSAIANAMLGMVTSKATATVVLVTFEEEVPPQMRQFQRPATGPMPLESIRAMREQLQRMQFKVETWNLAEENAREKKPKVEEGQSVVYVFLPPPPPTPMFMMRQQQQQQKQFTPQDAEVAREILADGGRGIFLANWDPQPPARFGPPAEYGWGAILRDDWGINVDTNRRVVRGEVERRTPGRYAINVVQWWYMQLSSFTQQPIGSPLRARRMLMKDVCPVVRGEQVPAGVKISPVLEVPEGTTDIWAEKDIERIFAALQT
ncbi:MAG TPA: hypothetical protein VLM89_15330, partial [Phycisphaerae bacterium]|nr:hypothetical protein [Phycisphaerae bacterium]